MAGHTEADNDTGIKTTVLWAMVTALSYIYFQVPNFQLNIFNFNLDANLFIKTPLSIFIFGSIACAFVGTYAMILKKKNEREFFSSIFPWIFRTTIFFITGYGLGIGIILLFSGIYSFVISEPQITSYVITIIIILAAAIILFRKRLLSWVKKGN